MYASLALNVIYGSRAFTFELQFAMEVANGSSKVRMEANCPCKMPRLLYLEMRQAVRRKWRAPLE
jgi:hypothetical protein